MDERLIRFPVDSRQRWRNRRGERAVPCQVSDRWLEFSETAALVGGEHLILVDVMTLDRHDNPRKLCQLVLSRQDLDRTLNQTLLLAISDRLASPATKATYMLSGNRPFIG